MVCFLLQITIEVPLDCIRRTHDRRAIARNIHTGRRRTRQALWAHCWPTTPVCQLRFSLAAASSTSTTWRRSRMGIYESSSRTGRCGKDLMITGRRWSLPKLGGKNYHAFWVTPFLTSRCLTPLHVDIYSLSITHSTIRATKRIRKILYACVGQCLAPSCF